MFYLETNSLFFTYIPRFKIVYECSADPIRVVVLHKSDRGVSSPHKFSVKNAIRSRNESQRAI